MSDNAPIRVAMDELTLEEMAEVGELLGTTLDVVLSSPRAPLAVAALAWVVRRRTDPSFTYEQARALRLGDVDLVNPEDTDPEPPGAGNGATPQQSPEHGALTRAT